MIYIGSNGYVSCIDTRDGHEVWHNSLDGMGHHEISLCGQGQSIQYLQEVVRSQSSS